MYASNQSQDVGMASLLSDSFKKTGHQGLKDCGKEEELAIRESHANNEAVKNLDHHYFLVNLFSTMVSHNHYYLNLVCGDTL